MEHRSPALPLPAIQRMPDGVLLGIVVVIGLLCSAALFFSLRQTEALRIQEIRNASAQTVIDALELDITRTVEATHNAGLMVETQPQLQRLQFNAYMRRVMADLHTITVLQWQPLVDGRALGTFETTARAQGLADYRVLEPDTTPPQPVALRNEYLPVLYEWPEDHGALGRDQIPDARAMQPKHQARVIGRPAASATFPIASTPPDSGLASAISVSSPVYERDPLSGGTQRHLGYVVAEVPLKALLREASYRADLAGLDMLIYDLAAPDDQASQPIYTWYGGAADKPQYFNFLGSSKPADFGLTVDMATRPWEVVLRPRAAFQRSLPASQAPYLLAVALAATALVTWAVWRAQRYHRRIEAAKQREQAAREQLATEQKRLQNIIEGTGVATWEFDYQTRQLRISERWTSLAGYAPQDLSGDLYARWLELVHPDDLKAFFEALAQHFAGHSEHLNFEYRLRHQQGHWIWIAARARLMERAPDGTPLLLAGTHLEITERKEAEARIQELNATLELRMQEALARSEARATMGTLIASVSHEMGTPMGNSLMTASTLVDQARHFQSLLDAGTLRKSTLQQFVEQVREGNGLLLRNLERAVALLKSFRQVAADQASEQRRSFDVRQVLDEVMLTLAPSLKRQTHSVELEVPEDIRMDSYPGPLGQVVINLINNAYLHAFEAMERGVVHLRVQATATHITLTCADNGRGIAPDILEKMFQPFFSTRIGSGGTGLGMSIVDNLVKATLGGTLEVHSVPGQGTTITITLPRVAPEPSRSDEV
jgi:PAS domain S-box-containing protein